MDIYDNQVKSWFAMYINDHVAAAALVSITQYPLMKATW